MKTFLLNIPKRLRIESQKLDAQAFLCDRAWTVFNDEGVKQLFIFQTDGSLLITIDGEVYNSTWKYLTANNSVVITSEGKSRMFHPAFMDSIVFALEQDGGAECLFMIDEVNQKAFSPKTLSDLKYYFNRKEKLLLDEEKKRKEQEKQKQIEEEEQQRREAERLKREKEADDRIKYEEKIRQDAEKKLREEAIELEESLFPNLKGTAVVVAAVMAIILLFILLPVDLEYWGKVGLALLCFCYFFFICLFICSGIHSSRKGKWKKEHPNDPRNKYLT